MKTTQTLRCKGCRSEAVVDGVINNVGALQTASGFFCVLLADGRLTWVCRGCWSRLRDGYKQIAAVLGDDAPNASLFQLSLMAESKL